MSTITESYKQAELALAAYSNLTPGISGKPYTDALEVNGDGMSAAQATHFASIWSVVAQSEDPLTGVSATVFQEVATGKRYLAIRGTQGLTDYLADYLIINGTPSTLNPQYQALKAQVQNWLGNGTLTSGFTVSGHSLGGYLAAGLVADFGTSISQAYLYNAPGNNSLVSQIAQALGFSGTPDAAKITSLRADAGISPIAGLGNDFAPPISIAIENQFLSDVSNPPGSYNHSQRVLTDAIALYAAYARADSTASVTSITNIIKASSNLNGNTLERALDKLRELLLGATVPGTVPANTRNTWLIVSNCRTRSSVLNNYIQLQQTSGGIPNEGLVTNLNVQGEVAGLIPLAQRIGNEASIDSDHPGLDVVGSDLHSIALLNVFLQSNVTAPSFKTLSDVTFKLPDLMKMIFDENLFASDPLNKDAPVENLLERLVKHEAGVRDPATGATTLAADAMVTRFTADLWKVAQDGGFTLTNKDIANTLVAFAMQKYYEEPASGADHGKELFTEVGVTGGIRFDRTDVAAKLSDAKGWQLYFQNYLNTLTLEEHRIVLQLLPACTDWFIQASSVSMSATADASKAFMVGGIGNDWMAGGSEADLLIGNDKEWELAA